MTIESTLAEIERTDVDKEKIDSFTRKSEHFGIAFNLLRETAGLVCLLASVSIGGRVWNIQQAVLGGQLVRAFKLMRFVLEEAIERRGELINILARSLAEGVINLVYLIKHWSPELVASYLHHSLQHERELRETIEANVTARGGMMLPVERRMLESIERAFTNSLVIPEDLPSKRIRNWGSTNQFEKADAVGLGTAYLGIFSGPSRMVHGGWQDLLSHHLNVEAPGQFTARLDFTPPQAQVIYALSHLWLEGLQQYVAHLDHPDLSGVHQRLRDLSERNSRASSLHEDFLSRDKKPLPASSPSHGE